MKNMNGETTMINNIIEGLEYAFLKYDFQLLVDCLVHIRNTTISGGNKQAIDDWMINKWICPRCGHELSFKDLVDYHDYGETKVAENNGDPYCVYCEEVF